MLLYYGSEINGLVSSILQFIGYFNLVEAGISGAAVYELYKPLANKDHEGISSVASAARIFYIQSGYIFLALTTILAIVYPFYIKPESLSFIEVMLLIFVLGMNGCLEFFTLAKYRSLLTADQKTYIISVASIIYTVLQTIFVYILSRMHINIVVLRFFVLFAIIVRTLIMLLYCRKHYPYINYHADFPKNILNKRWDALVLQILGAIQVGAPVVILTLVVKDLKVVSVYSIYHMIIGGICCILSIFISGLAASFGDVIARKQQNILQQTAREFECVYYAILSVAFGTTFVVFMPFINIYTKGVTDVNYNLPFVGFLFTLNALLYDIKTPQGMLVISAGLYKETRFQTATQGLIMLIGGLLLTPCWGIVGVLAASCASNLYRDIDLMFFIPHKLTKLPVKETFVRIVVIFLNISIIILVCRLLPLRRIYDYFDWCIYTIKIVATAIMIVLFTTYLFERDLLICIIARLKKLRRQ